MRSEPSAERDSARHTPSNEITSTISPHGFPSAVRYGTFFSENLYVNEPCVLFGCTRYAGHTTLRPSASDLSPATS